MNTTEKQKSIALRAGLSELAPVQTENAFIDYSMQRLKDGIKPITIKGDTRILKQLSTLADINNPESVKLALAELPVKDSTKRKIANTYASYAKHQNIPFKKPKYKREETLPFIPTEEELNTLIASFGKSLSTFLATLKDTGARCGELIKLQWQDIDFKRNTIHIKPEKNSNARILPLTKALITALNTIPKRPDGYVFARNLSSTRYYFNLKRIEISNRLNNPRLKQISFHTFRHWKGTTEYHKTKDVMHVKYVLGHKNIQTTMTYITLEKALYTTTTDEYTCKTAKDEQEAINLIETGFDYITDMNGIKLFRKRK